MRTFEQWLWRCGVSVLLLVLAGCAAVVPAPKPLGVLERIDPQYGYRFSNLEKGPGNSDGIFMVLAFSGGGNRSAALAYGVLDKLRQTQIRWEGQQRRLLDEVDIINSVSGGSYAAAYYGLFGDSFFSDFPDHFLNADFQSELWDYYVSMKGFSQLVGLSNNDRVDKLSQMIEQRLFGKKTFGDMLARRERPLIVIHATDLNRGADFQFTQEQFDPMCADLSTLPVARAVAASSAVPILFGPVTIKNNSGQCGYVRPNWIEQVNGEPLDQTRILRASRRSKDHDSYLDSSAASGRPWIHLIDGGISDNLGLRGPLESSLARGGLAPLLTRMGMKGVRKVVFVVVSAEVLPDSGIDQTGEPPSATQMATAVVDALMNNNSFETLTWLRSSFRFWREQALDFVDSKDSPYSGFPDFYLVEAHLNDIADPGQRNRLMKVPTALRLDPEQVRSLVEAGGSLLEQSPEFQRLLRDLK